jgi:hypothetical protein
MVGTTAGNKAPALAAAATRSQETRRVAAVLFLTVVRFERIIATVGIGEIRAG